MIPTSTVSLQRSVATVFDSFVDETADFSLLSLSPLQGSSVIMYRTAELRRHMYFVYSEWTGE